MEAKVNTGYYDQVFLVPVARRTPLPRPKTAVARSNPDAMIDWEFSDAMRDLRFLPGWYMLPVFGVAGLATALFAWL
jgi:hypothetical protein